LSRKRNVNSYPVKLDDPDPPDPNLPNPVLQPFAPGLRMFTDVAEMAPV
jgi:hypothetical protein